MKIVKQNIKIFSLEQWLLAQESVLQVFNFILRIN